MSKQGIPNAVRRCRLARGWSQAELAGRAGLSRTGVGAIEAGRLVPSVAAALALAGALGCRVEDLFAAPGSARAPWAWAEPPGPTPPGPRRYWGAVVGDRRWLYPVQGPSSDADWHDGVSAAGVPDGIPEELAERTLVVASCDPAAGLLAREYARRTPFRMIVLRRSSRQALELLARRQVHLAGVHMAASDREDGNRAEVRERAGRGCQLVEVAQWEEGLAVAPHLGRRSLPSLLRARLRWIGREPGSGARACLDELLAGRAAPRRVARDHRGVVQAIADGWADIGVCVRLVSDEAGLRFVLLRRERYELGFASDQMDDPRMAAFLALLRRPGVRRRLSELPGYTCRSTGEIRGADTC